MDYDCAPGYDKRLSNQAEGQLVQDGLRILAHMIAKKLMQGQGETMKTVNHSAPHQQRKTETQPIDQHPTTETGTGG